MNRKTSRRLVREGDFAADVDVDLIEGEYAWAPYISLDDVYKLDEVREALRVVDIERAAGLAHRVYRLIPMSG